MKRFISVLSVLIIFALVFTACGTSTSTPSTSTPSNTASTVTSATTPVPQKEVTLTASTNLVGEHAKVLEDMLKSYSTANPNVKIEFSAPGKEYDPMMKLKMAANEMPDLFSTHGWSKTRYGKFCADLKDRPWAANLEPSFKGVVSDEAGKVYTLAFDQDKSGIVYNVDVFQKYSVTVPTTYDEFLAACETIKTKSAGAVSPITCAAEMWEEAQFFDYFGSALLISPKENSAKQLLDGSFDWTKWDTLAQMWSDLNKKGYINKDVLTAKYNDNAKAFAEGKAAIGFYGPYFIDEAKKVNANLKADMMPIPSIVAGDTATFAGGEKSTLSAWIDSKNLDATLKVLDFCATPENVSKVCTFSKLPPSFTGVTADAGEMAATYEKYKDLRTLEYLDRVYLPSGMWDVMCKNSQMIIAGKEDPKKFSDNMKKEYLRLRSAAK